MSFDWTVAPTIRHRVLHGRPIALQAPDKSADRSDPCFLGLLNPPLQSTNRAATQNSAKAQHQMAHCHQVGSPFQNLTILRCRTFNIGFGLLSKAAASCGDRCRIGVTAWRVCSVDGEAAGTAAFSAPRLSTRHSETSDTSPE